MAFLKMPQIFPESETLKRIIERHGWSLYDVTLPPGRIESLSWKEVEFLSPAERYERWHTYMFLPNPTESQTLGERYAQSRREGLMPALVLPHRRHSSGLTAVDGYYYPDTFIYFLSELFLKEHEVVTMCQLSAYAPYSPTVHIPLGEVRTVFEKYFSIIQPTEHGVRGLNQFPKLQKN